MKTIALLAILSLSACASSGGFNDDEVYDCSSGQELGIQAGLEAPRFSEATIGDRLTMLVEVSNNSHEEKTVTTVRVDQTRDQTAEYVLESGYGNFNQAIAEGESHLFRLSMNGRYSPSREMNRRTRRGEIGMIVSVKLADGDLYRCSFSVPSPE